MCFRSLTSSSSTSSVAAVDTDIPPLQEKYDVFISFRGKETRKGFTSHLHKALLLNNIETYMDDRLEKGDDIGPALLKAIGRSKIALVIFSEKYAFSTWCLKELVHILGCKKSHGQIVIPIFYLIDPSDVRKQRGTYAPEDRPLKRSRDEVANWRAALEEAANMSGFHYSSKTERKEAHFVEEVVQTVLTKLKMSTKPNNNTERGEAKRGNVMGIGVRTQVTNHKHRHRNPRLVQTPVYCHNAFNFSGNTIDGSKSGRVGIFEFGNKNVYKGHKKEKQVDSCSGETDSASGGENEE